MNNSFEYVPGNCNLGKKETERRKWQAIAGILLTIIVVSLLQYYKAERVCRIIVVAPLTYSVLCYFQWKEKFCVVFGMYGVYNLTDVRKPVVVQEENFRKADKKKAWKVSLLSLLIGAVVTLIYFCLP